MTREYTLHLSQTRSEPHALGWNGHRQPLPHIELEYAPSPSLEHHVQTHGSLSPWEACNLGVGLADVLDYLHDETWRADLGLQPVAAPRLGV